MLHENQMAVLTSFTVQAVSWRGKKEKKLKKKKERKTQSKDKACVVPGTLHLEHSFPFETSERCRAGRLFIF